MSTTSARTTRRKPVQARPLRLRVLRRSRPTPSFARVTLGGGEIADFVPMGFDQWFRLYLPTGADSEASLGHVPGELTTASYARFMLVPASRRPTLRNYTVRDYRPDGPDGPELDVDFVVHGSAGSATAGPASTWAQTCAPGDEVVIVDEGTIYGAPDTAYLLLAADESALPALAGIVAALPQDARGIAVVEVPHPDDRQPLGGPDGVEIRWVGRGGGVRPGASALAAVRDVPVPPGEVAAWVAGESDLATGARRHWVRAGVAKSAISFCGYWKAGGSH